MEKLLSICIPTFNRAALLDRQLAWLFKEIQALGHECEVIVSDNCSEDDTPVVVQKWQAAFSHTTFRSNRNPKNLGWMHNFLYCLNAASGRYTWIIGDDDVIYDGALAQVIKTLKERTDLSLLYLNFSDYNPETGVVKSQHWFDPDLEDANSQDGKAIFQKCIQDNIGSVIFISATVFRTQYAREAQQQWPEAMENWAGLAYWNGYCAAKGSVLVTRKNYLECTIGVSYWQKDPRAWFRICHWDIPEVYVKLQQVGYSRRFCRKMILQTLKNDFSRPKLLTNLKYYFWCFLTAPRWFIKVVVAYINFLLISIFHSSAQNKSSNYSLIGSQH